MRKILLSFFLATAAATPALAQTPNGDESTEAREERRSQRSEARKERTESRSERVDARTDRIEARTDRVEARTDRAQSREPARIEHVERVERRTEIRDQNAAARERRTESRPGNVNERVRPTLEERRVNRDAVTSAQSAQRQQQIDQRREELRERMQQQQQQASQARQRVRIPEGARPDRPAPPPPVASTTRTPAPNWGTTWRRDHRYDWRDYRRRHRSLFHLGFYFDPFGWGYYRWGIGWRLWPSYYDRYYWLNDPWMYRLPYAPWPYRWIRYYNDALLVNVITGQVVDVEYNFFW